MLGQVAMGFNFSLLSLNVVSQSTTTKTTRVEGGMQIKLALLSDAHTSHYAMAVKVENCVREWFVGIISSQVPQHQLSKGISESKWLNLSCDKNIDHIPNLLSCILLLSPELNIEKVGNGSLWWSVIVLFIRRRGWRVTTRWQYKRKTKRTESVHDWYADH